ncbi:MAG: exodeoxyribonuclease VII small subunit [Clostridia bacterium]|nr:exodeoxyribonuclease VII small subunit [Clostridia bacterium]
MEKINFEESIQKLENIAIELEKGELSLEESLTKFEEGMKLSKQCNEIIENAEKKITVLLEKEGKLEEQNFELEE